MPSASARTPSVDNDMLPLGDVTLVPFGLSGVSEADFARAMAAQAIADETGSDATAPQHVRRASADLPPAFRLGALAALIRRKDRTR
jgi:hypothetical protein